MGRLCLVVVLVVFAGIPAAACESLPGPDKPVDAHVISKPLPRLKRHPIVALTFDDLPASGALIPGQTRVEIASSLARVLRAHHLKGTYGFVVGSALEDDPDAQQALRIWLRDGMKIGNHTFSHPSLTDVSAAAYELDIAQDESALAAYGKGEDWHWFRYPYLYEGDTLAKRHAVRDWLRAHGYRIAQVTLNFNDDDWGDAYDRCVAKHDEASIAWLRQSYLANAAEFIRVGRQEELIAFGHEVPNVLLLHETAFTTLMLPDLLELLQRRGFRFASLAAVERDPAYALDPDAALPDGGSLPNEFLNSRHLQYPPFTPEPEGKLNSICQ
jgi:peptidoglycan-N-acetylglucosamine deacetylase